MKHQMIGRGYIGSILLKEDCDVKMSVGTFASNFPTPFDSTIH